MTTLAVANISYRYKGAVRDTLSEVSFSVSQGDRLAIIGKNGCGKSTILKCMAGLLLPRNGQILLDNRDNTAFSRRERARMIAYVPQASGRLAPLFSVHDFVSLGRFPYQGFFALKSSYDLNVVRSALELTDTTALSDRLLPTLSGGELQRVYLAAAVAQESNILLLDEPMTFLDPEHEVHLQEALDRIHAEQNTTIISVTHDINLALNRHSHIAALVNGRLHFFGTTQEFRMKSLELLSEIFTIPFTSASTKQGAEPFLVPESFLV